MKGRSEGKARTLMGLDPMKGKLTVKARTLVSLDPMKGRLAVKAEPMDFEEEEEEAPQIDFYPTTVTAYNQYESDQEAKESLESEDELMTARDEVVVTGKLKDIVKVTREAEDVEEGGAIPRRRQFRCSYCGIVSKWNRRDIRLHILHVHMKVSIYIIIVLVYL